MYEGNPVYRAYRDINTAGHHAMVGFDTVSGGQMALMGHLGEHPVPHLSPEIDQGNALELTRAWASCPGPEAKLATWTNAVSGQR